MAFDGLSVGFGLPEIHHAAFSDDTYVMSGFYRDNSYDLELKVGTYDGGYHIGRSFVRFDTSPINYGSVQRAELHAAERHSWDCNYWPEPAYRVTGGWNGRSMPDWSNQPPVDPNWAGGTWSGGACGSRTAVWNVTGFAAHWAANPGQSWGVSLRATNEGHNSMYKKYATTETGAPPALHVWYNPPNQPPANSWAVNPTNGTRVLSSTTTASAYYADPEGTTGKILFGVWDANSTLLWAAWSGSVCNYCQGHVTLPYLADGWYQVWAIGHDGQAYSAAWTGPQWYFVDTRPPNPPTSLTPAHGAVITSPPRASAVYTEPYGWAGHMYFWLLDGTGRVVKEGWDDGTMAGRTTAYGGTATFALPPLGIGTYSVYAMSYDGALSPQVGPNTFKVATAPGAPSGLNGTAGPDSAHIKWTAAAPNGSDVTRYDFTAYDSTDPAAPPVQRRCENPCSPTNGFVFSGLVGGHTYTFKATASNAVGTGPQSGASNAVTANAWGQYAPTVTATALDGAATVAWRAELLATSYRVRTYRGSRPADGRPRPEDFLSQTEVLAVTSTTVSGLKNGTPYYFTVTPVYLLLLVGAESIASNEAIPFGKPFAPVITGVEEGDSAATLSWRAPDPRDGIPGDNGRPITSYKVAVHRDGGELVREIPDVPAGETQLQVGGLVNGSRYYFTIAAANVAGLGEVAQSASLSPFGAPFAPVNVAASGGSRRATVTWEPPPPQGEIQGDNGRPITGYRVLVEPPCPNGPCPGTTGIPADTYSADVTGLRAGTNYSFRVVAVNERGAGTPSAAATAKTFVEPPSEPTGVQAVAGNGEVRLSWNPPSELNGSELTGYEVLVEPGCSCTGLQVTDPGATSTTVGGLANGTTYSFRIRATSSAGVGALSAPAEAVPDLPVYLAVGDSFSSGQGEPPYDLSEECARSSQAYAPKFAGSNWKLDFRACGGDVIAQIEAQLQGMPAHEVCTHDFWMNGYSDLKKSFHPNGEGYDEMANQLRQVVR